jgi:hypothetical protein
MILIGGFPSISPLLRKYKKSRAAGMWYLLARMYRVFILSAYEQNGA